MEREEYKHPMIKRLRNKFYWGSLNLTMPINQIIQEAKKELIVKMLDPELIAKYGKTQEERMAINTYLRSHLSNLLRTKNERETIEDVLKMIKREAIDSVKRHSHKDSQSVDVIVSWVVEDCIIERIFDRLEEEDFRPFDVGGSQNECK